MQEATSNVTAEYTGTPAEAEAVESTDNYLPDPGSTSRWTGHHGHHKRKYNEDQLRLVRSFIEELPKYQSHYSRSDNPNRMFMTMEYTTDNCYEVYQSKCLEENGIPVFLDKFRRIFTEEYNITFKAPKSDFCSTCDSIYFSLVDAKAKNNVPRIEQLNTELDLHHKRAQARRKAIANASKEVSENPGTYAITFDLQQALPIPKLYTRPTFYKKKVFCYNFSIHCLHSSQGYFYTWDETTAGRGHTLLPSDRDPKCWEEVLKKVQKKTSFKVYRMTQLDFKNISTLRQHSQQPTSASFGIRNAVRMEFSSEDLPTMHASQSYSGEAFDAPFMEDLPLKYDTPLEIHNSKLEHVMSCLPWIPQAYHGISTNKCHDRSLAGAQGTALEKTCRKWPVQGSVKPNAKFKDVVDGSLNDIYKLGSNDFAVILSGTTDFNSQEKLNLKVVTDYLEKCATKNVIVCTVSYCFHEQSLNEKIYKFNAGLYKKVAVLQKQYNVNKFLVRNDYTRQGLHFNIKGKYKLRDELKLL
ncbi:hypothetical protein ILUMI_13613 [Ignelater luminosus]|uniref:Uncharacterized protein n=1 Tax=Ignelater luminosus TaxID=2038154 RepID=A0A8K0CRZ3_IGNLU|nr:hypothetical protein ILUMI_13613 [Ignelater luminosus]